MEASMAFGPQRLQSNRGHPAYYTSENDVNGTPGEGSAYYQQYQDDLAVEQAQLQSDYAVHNELWIDHTSTANRDFT